VLHNDLHLEKFNLRYVPHSLEADQKRSRVELSQELLQILEQDQQYEFEHILAGDESGFLNIFIIRAGAQSQMTCLKFRSKKFNLKSASFRLFGGSTGIKSLLYVPRSMRDNTIFFVESVVPDLVEYLLHESQQKMLRGILVHLDNARSHNGRKVRQL
jgi:hypothetical protein